MIVGDKPGGRKDNFFRRLCILVGALNFIYLQESSLYLYAERQINEILGELNIRRLKATLSMNKGNKI